MHQSTQISFCETVILIYRNCTIVVDYNWTPQGHVDSLKSHNQSLQMSYLIDNAPNSYWYTIICAKTFLNWRLQYDPYHVILWNKNGRGSTWTVQGWVIKEKAKFTVNFIGSHQCHQTQLNIRFAFNPETEVNQIQDQFLVHK